MSSKLLIIGFVWPEPKSSAAGIRILQLIEQFKKQNYTITFVTTANHSVNAFDLASIGVSSINIELNNSSFDVFVKDLNPDVVLFDRFMTEEQFGWRVAEQCPNALRVLDTEDFHGLRKGRALAIKQDEMFSIKHLQNDVTKREVASIYRCDVSLMISEVEIDILTIYLGVDKKLLYYLPFLLQPISNEAIDKFPSFDDRVHFVTIGNFLHPPNYDAVLYLKQEIWPLIRKELPKAELHIYGAYESPKITQLHNEAEGFLVKGFTEDVNTVMQNAKVCLAPLRFGAGLKGKLIDAMQNGTPSVMSTIAAEGIFGTSTPLSDQNSDKQSLNEIEASGYITNIPEEFAEQAIALYTNAEQWKVKQQNGFKVLKERFNAANFEDDFAKKIENLRQNLQQHRQDNFTGQLLMHHTLQSTKYMSKWIEEKNNSDLKS
ncbi:MAG: glycosyltransferase [Winogradskyella sp.]|uniref:glycosyltransferase family 4 protein n=1 Tax=Winogradskyella sp. TaxID=1883156 RepID=UPI000F3B8B30|nr:glycosyltransferase family 4 protein [Winogradskyella sp.]RNC87004.1 MAG: glycosyltransferase [Winogradskyella sp.]